MSTQSDKSTLTAGPSVWSYVPGLLWAALMLAVLTWWLRAQNYEFGTPIWIGTAALAAVSLALAVCLLWQSRQERVDAVGEVTSMAVMGLICLGAGLSLRATPSSPLSRQRLFQGMLASRRNVAVALIIVGSLVAVLGVYTTW